MKSHSSNILHSELFESGVLRLTLDDQNSRNALSDDMLAHLTGALTAAEANDVVRVIVLAGKGPAFCAGHDLKQITAARAQEDGGKDYFKRLFDSCGGLMQLIVSMPKPIIAEISGVATAAGCQLVASCDLAFAADSAKFATPGVNIGLFCSTPMVALSRNVAHKHAMEMLLTGEFLCADRAQEIGLINRSVIPDQLSAITMALANKIASKSSMTLAVGKQAFYRQAEMSLYDAYDYSSQVMVENMLTHDANEGIGAFIDKRPPAWKDQ